MPGPGCFADHQPLHQGVAGHTLFVVDWDPAGARDLQHRLQASECRKGAGRGPFWQVLNCPTTALQAGGAGRGLARVAQGWRYLLAALKAAWQSRRHDQVVVWRQSIGFLLCALPRWPAGLCTRGRRPQLVLTTVLLSPSSTTPGTWRRWLLELALRRADALVYFSRDMALDTAQLRPAWAHKVFWMPLPLFGEPAGQAALAHPGDPGLDDPGGATASGLPAAVTDISDATAQDTLTPSVFCGGTSDRDFDVVIEAFRHRRVPVTLVCREDQTFRPPGPVEPHFTVRRGVTEQEYHALAAAAGVVVVALKSATSGCGQLLFSFCMRHGVPVIATDCFGTRDEVEHGRTGWLVPAGDAHALGRAYDRLAADPGLRRRLARQARAQALSRQEGLAGFAGAMNALGDTLRGAPAPEAPRFPQRPRGTAARAADQPIGEAA